MTVKRINIPAILMVMAILAIIAFQGYWMYKNYEEEEKTLQIRTTAMFRNVAYRLQAENLKGDTNVHVWATSAPSAHAATAVRVSEVDRQPGSAGRRRMPGYGRMVLPALEDTTKKPLQRPGERIIIRAFADADDSNAHFRSTMPLDSLKVERIRSIAVQKMIHPSRAGEGATLDTSIAITIGSDHAVFQQEHGRSLKGSFNSVTINKKDPQTVIGGSSESPKPARVNIRAIRKDTLFEYMVLSRLMEDGNFLNLLQRVDSLKDTVSLDELGKRFRAALDKESMKLDFDIEKDSLSIYPPNETIDPTRTNEVVMGYGNNYFLRYELLNKFQYITRKLSSQIGLSLLLIALTSFTFVLLYRNLMKQRRLTQFKNDLISNITHELKTPIATVSVAIEALKNFHAMDDPRRTEEYLDISNSELQRLSLLVDKVLRLSMFEKHQVELKMERFDLKQLVEEVISSMRLQFEKVKARVQLQADEDASIEADRLHITSVIFNLLDNAMKYGKANLEITVSIKRNDAGLQLIVSDNGIGIPAAYRKKVFDKFFRVPSGDTHNVKGYGLGLSYVAYVVERHRGKIEVVSEPGEGSSFIIQLPDRL
jgi:two-component system phosphate regulon sensor histidine kinase PhoR